MLRWIIFIIIYILLDVYAFQAFKTAFKSSLTQWVYYIISFLFLATLVYQFITRPDSRQMSPATMYFFGAFLAFMLLKLVLIIFLFAEDIIRLGVGLFSKIGGSEGVFEIPSRRKFLSTLALGIAAIPFASLLVGMVRGKYNYRVLKYNLEFDDLPEAFHNYTLTQISDVHSGSFDNEEKVAYGIDLINKQNSDVIFFTGDLVNNTASEMLPWQNHFKNLKAKDGVFSVLGNHDYGDYVRWENQNEKEENLKQLKTIQKEMGWHLLLNENVTLKRENDTIKLIGVENWGAGGFKKAGDLEKACVNVTKSDFKILLSHDPSHWATQIKKDERHFHLTLSGHTHGMQFGIEIPGWIKWSPVKYRYENWAGIYEEMGRYINVNRGFGFIGYPGRVGIWPEITVITLKKKGFSA